MDQLLRLLRAKCAYCSHLKLHPAEVNRFKCKLRLIRYGLLEAGEELENIHLKSKMPKSVGVDGLALDGSSSESEEEDSNDLIQRRNDFVKRAIKKAGGKKQFAGVAAHKIEAVSEERRLVIREFLASITKTKVCGSCKG